VKNSLAAVCKLTAKRATDPFFAGGAAEVAFFLMLSLVPSAILLAQLLNLFRLSLDAIRATLEIYLTPDVLDLVMPLLGYTPSNTITILLLLLALWAGSRAIFSLMRLSNYAYGFRTTKNPILGWVRERARAIFLTVVVLITLLFTLYILVFGEYVAKAYGRDASFSRTFSFYEFWYDFRWPVAFLLFFFAIYCLYYFLPLTGGKYAELVTESRVESVKRITLAWFRNRGRQLRKTVPGALFAAVTMLIATWLYTLYIRVFALNNFNILYGGISSIVVLLIWFYGISFLLIIGIQLNAAVEELRAGRRQ